MSAPVCSRRVSAGITPAPGTLGRLPVWWGRVDWTRIEVPVAVWAHRDLCREHHVSPDTVIAVARAMAGYADAATGRSCRPTNERLREAARLSQSTVQRARRVLKALRLVVVITKGQTVMTLAQRLKAWDRGSSHRAVAAEFALCSRRDRRPVLAVDNPAAGRPAVDRDHPPVGQVVRTSATEIRGSLRDGKPKRGGRSAPAHTEKSRPRPGGVPDLRSRRLAEAVRSRLAWLAGVPTSRMVPTLHRFALAGWTHADVVAAVQDALAARAWRVPVRLEQPAAYLATLLRERDPEDRPGALEAAMEEFERQSREYERLRTYGPPCPHGMPAGHITSPRGMVACPFCRGADVDVVPMRPYEDRAGGSRYEPTAGPSSGTQ